MKLYNNGEAFVIKFNGDEYTIPSGEFETKSDGLIQHIRIKAIKWGKSITEDAIEEKIEITVPEKIVVEAVAEVKEEPKVEAVAVEEKEVKKEKKAVKTK